MTEAAIQRGRHEEDVSTEQSQAEANARLSCPDGNTGRTSGAEAASRQGKETAHGSDPAKTTAAVPRVRRAFQSFDKSQRILKREEFLEVQAKGRRVVAGLFVVLTLARATPGKTRLGITASRKVGSAVVRNRIKRLIREFFRRHYEDLPPSLDIVVIARMPRRRLTYADVERELGRVLLSAEGPNAKDAQEVNPYD